MPYVRETVTIGGTTPVTTGVTQTSRGNEVPAIKRKTTDLMFDNAVFGVSVTSYSATGVPSWAIEVRSDIGGFEHPIAGVTGILGVSSLVMPIWDRANGTTLSTFIGVPCPTTVDIVGSSTTVGATFGCVVTLNLHSAG